MRQINRKVLAKEISAGTSRALSRFERAVAMHEWSGARDAEERLLINDEYNKAKQALLRRLLRVENSTNEGSIEQLKRDFRKLAAAYVEVCTTGKDSADMWQIAQQVVTHKRRL